MPRRFSASQLPDTCRRRSGTVAAQPRAAPGRGPAGDHGPDRRRRARREPARPAAACSGTRRRCAPVSWSCVVTRRRTPSQRLARRPARSLRHRRRSPSVGLALVSRCSSSAIVRGVVRHGRRRRRRLQPRRRGVVAGDLGVGDGRVGGRLVPLGLGHHGAVGGVPLHLARWRRSGSTGPRRTRRLRRAPRRGPARPRRAGSRSGCRCARR